MFSADGANVTRPIALKVGMEGLVPREASMTSRVVADFDEALDFIWADGHAVQEIWIGGDLASTSEAEAFVTYIGEDWPGIAVHTPSTEHGLGEAASS